MFLMRRMSLDKKLWCFNYFTELHGDFTEISQRSMDDKLTERIIGAAIEVHKALGPGLLESAYQKCLFYELESQGFDVKQEIPLPITYKDIVLDHGYRIDFLVENEVVIEIKTVEKFTESIPPKY